MFGPYDRAATTRWPATPTVALQPPSAAALVRYRCARPRHLLAHAGGRTRGWTSASPMSAVAVSVRRSACALGLAAGFFRRLVGSHRSRAWPTRSWPSRSSCWPWGSWPRLGNTVGNIVLATAVINLPFYIRVARAEANVRRNAGWFHGGGAALRQQRLCGMIAVHICSPTSLPPAMVQLSLNMGWAILNAAGLSFIGLGVRPPDAGVGDPGGRGWRSSIVSGEWWVSLFPGGGADAGGVHLQPAG